jgi:hypothetical protein
MKRVNAYLREQGFDVKFGSGTRQGKRMIRIYRTRPFSKKGMWADHPPSQYSVGRFKFEDLEANLLNPKRRGIVGHRTEGWQRYEAGWYERLFDKRMNFKLPQFTPEQVKTIMTLILLEKLTK